MTLWCVTLPLVLQLRQRRRRKTKTESENVLIFINEVYKEYTYTSYTGHVFRSFVTNVSGNTRTDVDLKIQRVEPTDICLLATRRS